MTQKRLVLIVGGVLAALLVAVLVTLIVLLNTLNAQQHERDYQACMARHGFSADAPPRVAPGDEDKWIDGIASAAEQCMSLR